jgi:predicted membrane-bound mannosyltransferase/DNA-binding beta-propeller fold protein YncE
MLFAGLPLCQGWQKSYAAISGAMKTEKSSQSSVSISTTAQINIDSVLDRPILFKFNVENLLVVLLLILAFVSRFYDVGARTMAHDEVNHVAPAYDLYANGRYEYDPVTHGPLQFHLLALSYSLFGDSDFSARVPAAAFSTAAIAIVAFGFRRYLGRKGALIAAFLFLISPYMLYYGRYTRNEAFGQVFSVLTLFAVLRYLEKGDFKSLLLYTVVMAFHFTDKATSFIYSAELMIFLAVLFLAAVSRIQWRRPSSRQVFMLLMGMALLMVIFAVGFAVWEASVIKSLATTADTAVAVPTPMSGQGVLKIISIVSALLLGITGIILLLRDLGVAALRTIRSFDILILTVTLVLPQLGSMVASLLGWDPLNYTDGGIMLKTGIVVVALFALAIVLGLWWRPRVWLVCAVIFYAIFTVFYTTVFTSPVGFFKGLVGALGYWMSQQQVNRGTQPIYYYLFVQFPMYEYMAFSGALMALVIGWRRRLFSQFAGLSPAQQVEEVDISRLHSEHISIEETHPLEKTTLQGALPAAPTPAVKLPVLALLLYWAAISLTAFSLAGEKMPWLMVHILPGFLLASGWALGYLIERIPWAKLSLRKIAVVALVTLMFLLSANGLILSLLGITPPFQGYEMPQLQATAGFVVGVIVAGLSGWGLMRLLMDWKFGHILRLLVLGIFGVMAGLTARTAFRAAYINYDYPVEFLVYAHAAPDPKMVMAEIEDVSQRITGGKALKVCYDNDGLYPYWWYLRDYPNKVFFADTATSALKDCAYIISGEGTFGKLEPVVKDDFIRFDRMRLWWPIQDYNDMFKGLPPAPDKIDPLKPYNPNVFSLDRVWGTLVDPQKRTALFNIWFNRDYRLYAQINGRTNLTIETWSPASRMRVYVRKDIVSQIWNYGAVVTQTVSEDPFKNLTIKLDAEIVVGSQGTEGGKFKGPRDVAVAPDGSIYVSEGDAGSATHRIQHFDANLDQGGTPPGGKFNEPWGIGIAPDGSVYVADTWNYRIQKFSAEGEFIKMWNTAVPETGEGFYGPRDVAVDSNGRVYVTDTGNKRVLIYDSEGIYITQFGSAGLDTGKFDEPVGIAVDAEGLVYVADTWNERVQVFAPDAEGKTYFALREWPVKGWRSQSVLNKPYLALGPDGKVYVTDPEGFRILVFDNNGNPVATWTMQAFDGDVFGQPLGIAVDAQGRVWVTDMTNHRVLRFNLAKATLPTGGGQPGNVPTLDTGVQ